MAIDKRFECPDCGQMVLNLWNHGCPNTLAKKGGATKTPKTPQPVERLNSKPKAPVVQMAKPSVSKLPAKSLALSGSERIKKWRKTHPEEAKRVHREYMRTWRGRR